MSTQDAVFDTQPKANLIIRLFRGDVSLPVTYWVYGVLVGFVFNLVGAIVEKNYTSIVINKALLLSLQALFWLFIVYMVFIMIAIWRSANKHKGSKIWSRLAQVIVVFNVFFGFFLVWNMVANTQTGRLQKGIRLINKSLPVMIDEATQWSNITLDEKDLTYNYKLVKWAKPNIDIKRFSNALTSQVQTKHCQTKEIRSLLDDGMTIHSVYKDMNNKPVIRIMTTREDCR